MNSPVQGPIAHKAFHCWLKIGTQPLTVSYGDKKTVTMLKLPKTPDIDYVYGVSSDMSISWHDALTFCGVYDRQSHTLYLADSPLTAVVDGLTATERKNTTVLAEGINGRVNQRIESIIANDRGNLSVREVTSYQALRDLEYYQNYAAKEEAIRLLFAGQEPHAQFRSDYALCGLPEAAFIAWLQNPEYFIKTEAEQYIKIHQESILLDFLKKDALLTEYQALIQDTGSPIHRMKSIIDAVKGCGAKTVTVTVQKAGEELTFKASADSLTGHKNYYSAYYISASDRREFERLFGRHSDYRAEDITKITYGRNTIYEPPTVQTEKMGPIMQKGGM